jgi:hypothetical protein
MEVQIMATPKMTADEKRWKAESDANAMKQYAAIQSDPMRLRAAKTILTAEIKQTQKALKQTPPRPAQKRK